MGASELGWECCQSLLEMGQQVVSIFSIPQQFNISWSSTPVQNVRFRQFDDLAVKYSIPITYVTQKMSAYKQQLEQLTPDLIVVIGWYYMVPRSLRAIAPLGALGIHASLLPKYRGGAPLVWAMINGESHTGVSLFYLEDGIDDGDLVGQQGFEILPDETIADVIGKSTKASLSLVREYIPLIANGNTPKIQQDHTQATHVPQRHPDDGLLDWNTKTLQQAYDWMRAQSHPYPGAFSYLRKEKIHIWNARKANRINPNSIPGQIYSWSELDRKIGVWCADGGLLELVKVGLENGEVLPGVDLWNRGWVDGEVVLNR